nr:MAG TPA: hypothetical protein [Caudoviricetes sp.]
MLGGKRVHQIEPLCISKMKWRPANVVWQD